MLRWFWLLFLFTGVTSAQVTLISPEEGRKALKQQQDESQKQAARRADLLPGQFSSWKAASVRKFGPYSAATLAGADAPVLLEYQYREGVQRQYLDGARSLHVEALRMKDSSGSYGLFTYYRGEDWQVSNVAGGQAAVRGDQLLFRKDEVLVRASGARLSPEEIAALAGEVGSNGGGPLPSLPNHMPQKGLVPRSSKFITGPETFSRLLPGVPPTLVDFDFDAEAELAQYHLPGQPPLKLLLVSYPTPQVAASKLKAFAQPAAEPAPLHPHTQLFLRRSGPLLAFVFGATDKTAADYLLNQVNYSAEVVWNEPVEKMDAPKFGEFLVNVLILTGAWFLFAIVAGLLFGIVRILVKKWYPGQVFDRPEETEIIRLNLSR
jgi:hypothetical protein